jgi:hypothetical protein
MDRAKVGKKGLFRMPGMLSQMPKQGDIDTKIKVRVIENPADHPDELKLQAGVVHCRGRRCQPSRRRQRG